MRISASAPGRVNLIGDHTDYTGGLVFPMAIDRWTRIEAEPHASIDLVSDDEPEPARVSLDGLDLGGSASGWGRYVAAVAQQVRPTSGISGTVSTDIPIGAGLSSSAALELAVALALGFEGSAVELAELGRRAEHAATGVPTGIMDQLCIAAARPGHATLIDCGDLSIEHVLVPDDVEVLVRFVAHRTLEGSEYATRVSECAAAEEIVGPLARAEVDGLDAIDNETIRRRARHVVSENGRVRSFAAALAGGDYRTAGEIMTEGHESLRRDYETSTSAMDEAVAELVASPGVYGARMTGGGFGGCVVALCEPHCGLDGWVVKPVGGAAASFTR